MNTQVRFSLFDIDPFSLQHKYWDPILRPIVPNLCRMAKSPVVVTDVAQLPTNNDKRYDTLHQRIAPVLSFIFIACV